MNNTIEFQKFVDIIDESVYAFITFQKGNVFS